MTRDDIIRMVREAGFDDYLCRDLSSLERFAALVAAAEREACAKVCETLKITRADGEPIRVDGDWCADAIRARSEP